MLVEGVQSFNPDRVHILQVLATTYLGHWELLGWPGCSVNHYVIYILRNIVPPQYVTKLHRNMWRIECGLLKSTKDVFLQQYSNGVVGVIIYHSSQRYMLCIAWPLLLFLFYKLFGLRFYVSFWWYCSRSVILFPHDKMAAFSQTIFSDAFSWMKKFKISIKMSLNFVPKGSIDNNPALVQIMAWRQTGDKPLSEPILTWFTDAYIQH